MLIESSVCNEYTNSQILFLFGLFCLVWIIAILPTLKIHNEARHRLLMLIILILMLIMLMRPYLIRPHTLRLLILFQILYFSYVYKKMPGVN